MFHPAELNVALLRTLHWKSGILVASAHLHAISRISKMALECFLMLTHTQRRAYNSERTTKTAKGTQKVEAL